MTTAVFQQRLLRAIRLGRLWSPRARVVVGVSGGADSMALLDALALLAKRRDCQWELHVAHLDHGLRGRASQGDLRFVMTQATQRELPVHRGFTKSAEESARSRISIETAARRSRHAFFQSVAERIGAEAVAVAHHADDQAETVLHHILRGTGWTGLAGIPVRRPLSRGSSVMLVRPLLGFRRAELLEYLSMRRVPFRRDASNRDTRHTRNRIRHRLLPLLEKQFNPHVAGALLRLAEQASLLREYLTGESSTIVSGLKPLRRGPARSWSTPFDAWRAATPLVRAAALREMLERIGGPRGELSHERLMAVATGLSEVTAEGVFELPGGVRVRRMRRDLIIRMPAVGAEAEAVSPVADETPDVADFL